MRSWRDALARTARVWDREREREWNKSREDDELSLVGKEKNFYRKECKIKGNNNNNNKVNLRRGRGKKKRSANEQ